MSMNPNWIPMKWTGGPLEVQRRAKAQTFTPEVKGMLTARMDPAALELVRRTPVNCLVVEWAAGEPADRDQQSALVPLIEAGRRIGISFVGRVKRTADLRAAVAAGLQAGLSGVLVEGPSAQVEDFPVILQCSRSNIPWDSHVPILSVTDNRWPGLEIHETEETPDAVTGPTGVPWVNSNGWFSLLARQLAAGKALWLDMDPPPQIEHWRAAGYSAAVADSYAYGSRWMISLDEKLSIGALRRQPEAIRIWERVVAIISFFKEHADWAGFQPQGSLTVVSRFRGEEEALGGEVLNLLSRQLVQYRVIETSRLAPTSLEGLETILWVDEEPPTSETRSELLDFVTRGGLLISASFWGPPDCEPLVADYSDHYKICGLGKGKIAASKDGFRDPYQVAVDTHLLMSRRSDWVRLFNAGTAISYFSADPNSRKELVQIIDYRTSGVSEFVTAWVRTSNRSALFWSLESKEPAPLQGVPAGTGVEFHLPSLSTYSALEFEHRGVG